LHTASVRKKKNKNSNRKDGLQTKCKICSRSHSRLYYSNSSTKNKENIIKRNKERKIEIRNFVLSYLKTHPCVDCGETDPVVLEFDHLYNKSENVNKLMAHSISIVSDEISKCEVRCANCHRRKTAKQFGSYKLG